MDYTPNPFLLHAWVIPSCSRPQTTLRKTTWRPVPCGNAGPEARMGGVLCGAAGVCDPDLSHRRRGLSGIGVTGQGNIGT